MGLLHRQSTTALRMAPAKINLTLHITGQRADGYHCLDSLVGFADLSDEISALPADTLSLTVSGPFKGGVPTGAENLVLRAAAALSQARGVTAGAQLHLTKTLPHAAGIGSASSDAAATLHLLARFWGVAPFAPSDPVVAALGADVPVCMAGPAPQRMAGIGHDVVAAPTLPAMALVLVNPGVAVPTADVFAGLTDKTGAPMPPLPAGLGLAGFCDWLGHCRNDLSAPAQAIAPEIGAVLAKLRGFANVRFAAMSGSGATCFAILPDMASARQVARAVQISQMGWWVAPAPLLA